jgi:hypothetical protein
MPAPDHVVTVINGVNVVNGIGSVATGYKTPDGGVDYTNTVIGIGGTAASAAQIAGGLGHTVPSWAGPVGAAAGVAGTVQNIQNINNATASGQNVQASDAFGVVAGLTGLGAGAVGVLLGTGAAIFWPLTLVSTLAGGIAWVASGNGWEFDPITGQTIPMTQDELQRNKEIFDDIQASIDELNDRTISTLLDPTATYIPRTPRYFDPICRRSSYSSSPKSTYRIVYTDPLAIDMDHDGLETANLQKAILFDHDGDGIKTGTGWLKGDDAWLVRDLNGNGTIDTGAEMFGDQTVLANGNKATSGLQALAALDSNGDGQINASDAAFSELKIWQDLNQDGVSQTNELKTPSPRASEKKPTA